MSENETAIGNAAVNTNENATPDVSAGEAAAAPAEAPVEEISYHAVEKDGVVTAIGKCRAASMSAPSIRDRVRARTSSACTQLSITTKPRPQQPAKQLRHKPKCRPSPTANFLPALLKWRLRFSIDPRDSDMPVEAPACVTIP